MKILLLLKIIIFLYFLASEYFPITRKLLINRLNHFVFEVVENLISTHMASGESWRVEKKINIMT